jgi:SAM-dependent methyltransferase
MLSRNRPHPCCCSSLIRCGGVAEHYPARMRDQDAVLLEQIEYYRARAADYLEQASRVQGFDELGQALLAFRPSGDVLELACGPGTWTPLLLNTAATVTAVDAAPEMLAQAKGRVGSGRVEYVQADLFSWQPTRLYDTVFFGFWLSHVPPERFNQFWRLVQDSLTTAGRVFFMDDAMRTSEETRAGPSSSTIVRTAADGSEHRLVKVPYTATGLQERLAALGWRIQVHGVADAFFWGSGCRAAHAEGP